ncbi:MAG: hypothetical protein EPO20_24025 [Betaproteobacteria bacterium]|nr:MAG: hypothetical protein EPO20_24025 [Betaproteobacteria bacterium]
MATLNEIDSQTKAYSAARGELSDAVGLLQEAIQSMTRKHLPVIKRRVQAAKDAEAALRATIEGNPDLFVKPRTLTLHGIKVGFRKAVGKLDWEDDGQVVKLIKRYFGDQADVLIVTKEKPAKEALEQLAAADLKKLGITVEETGDVVVIKDTASDVDKLVKALLKEDEEATA